MNDFLLAVLLGIIEGVTEFLPISSTAHLRIAQALLGLSLEDEFWKMFAVVIQFGAILSVVVYFRGRLTAFVREFLEASRAPETRGKLLSHPLALTLVAFLTTAIPAFLLSRIIGKNLESLLLIGTSLTVGGIAMWAIDLAFTRPRVHRVEEMTVGHAVWVGAAQILSAVFPGTSRSMSTIAGGQLVGLSREAALEFSFFVSIPTMAVATGYDLFKHVIRAPASGVVGLELGFHEVLVLLVGLVVSFAVALAVVAWFMAWVRRRGFVPFAVYRILLGCAVIVWGLSTLPIPS